MNSHKACFVFFLFFWNQGVYSKVKMNYKGTKGTKPQQEKPTTEQNYENFPALGWAISHRASQVPTTQSVCFTSSKNLYFVEIQLDACNSNTIYDEILPFHCKFCNRYVLVLIKLGCKQHYKERCFCSSYCPLPTLIALNQYIMGAWWYLIFIHHETRPSKWNISVWIITFQINPPNFIIGLKTIFILITIVHGHKDLRNLTYGTYKSNIGFTTYCELCMID